MKLTKFAPLFYIASIIAVLLAVTAWGNNQRTIPYEESSQVEAVETGTSDTGADPIKIAEQFGCDFVRFSRNGVIHYEVSKNHAYADINGLYGALTEIHGAKVELFVVSKSNHEVVELIVN